MGCQTACFSEACSNVSLAHQRACFHQSAPVESTEAPLVQRALLGEWPQMNPSRAFGWSPDLECIVVRVRRDTGRRQPLDCHCPILLMNRLLTMAQTVAPESSESVPGSNWCTSMEPALHAFCSPFPGPPVNIHNRCCPARVGRDVLEPIVGKRPLSTIAP